MMKPHQCRMARAALQWSVIDLARETGIAASTINRFETGQTQPGQATMRVLFLAFEGAGIEFIDERGVMLNPK